MTEQWFGFAHLVHYKANKSGSGMVGYSAKVSRVPFSVFPAGGNSSLSNQGIIINTLNHVLLDLAESGWDSPMWGL
jgi:hypothetical protein